MLGAPADTSDTAIAVDVATNRITHGGTRSPSAGWSSPKERLGTLPAVESFENRQGLGVQGVIEGRAVVAGRAQLLGDWSLHLPPELEAAKATAEAAGRTAIAAGNWPLTVTNRLRLGAECASSIP